MTFKYSEFFEQQNAQEINLKCFFENADQLQKPATDDLSLFNDVDVLDFNVFCDGVKYNRNLKIIDSRNNTFNSQKEFKVLNRLSKYEKMLLRKIKLKSQK